MEESKLSPDLEAFPEGRCRMILIGKTGAGKSATANTILGRDMFKSQLGVNSETKDCGVAITVRNGLEILLMDTPGLSDTDGEDSVMATKITQSLFAVAPGPHAVILVLRCDRRFTDEEVQVFNTLKDIFGPNMTSYLIIIFTGKDELDSSGENFEEQLSKAVKLKGVVAEANHRYLLFNNRAEMSDKMEQVDQLLLLVRNIVTQNDCGYFRHKMSGQMDCAMLKMVKEEIRNRMGDAAADAICGKERSHPQPGRPIPSSNPDHERRENNEVDEKGGSSAEQAADMRKKDLERLERQGAVKARLQEIRKRFSADSPDTEKPQSAAEFRSPRRSLNLRTSSTPDSRIIPSAAPSPDDAKQTDPTEASFEDEETFLACAEQTNLEIAPPFEDNDIPEAAPTNITRDWSVDKAKIDEFLDQFQDELLKELSVVDASPFFYEVPDEPNSTIGRKRRVVEDSLRRKIISRPETLYDVQRDELEITSRSVSQKVKKGMTKFSVKSLNQCRLM